jgi:hypothetical protein
MVRSPALGSDAGSDWTSNGKAEENSEQAKTGTDTDPADGRQLCIGGVENVGAINQDHLTNHDCARRVDRRVERSVFLYWGSDYDQLIKKGLQRIRGSREFAENLSRYTEQDPCGRARWERLSHIMTEVETRRNEAQPEMAEVEAWTEQLPTTQEGG